MPKRREGNVTNPQQALASMSSGDKAAFLEVYILYQKRLITADEAWLALRINTLCIPKYDGWCWMSNADFAAEFGTTITRVQGWLKNLKDVGLISIHLAGRGRNQRSIRSKWYVALEEATLHERGGGTLLKRGGPTLHERGGMKGIQEGQQQGTFDADASNDTCGPSFFSNGKQHDPFDEQCATRFFKVLAGAGVVPKDAKGRPAQVKKSIEPFRLLREQDGHTKKEIKQVLTWWRDHRRDKYTPKPTTGAKFRERFSAILSAMKRDQETNVTISKAARAIYRDLDSRVPGTVNRQELLVVIERSLRAATELGKIVRQHELVVGDFGTPYLFTLDWFMNYLEILEDFDDWTGSVGTLTFHTGHKRFKGILSRWVSDYGFPSAALKGNANANKQKGARG